MEKVAIQCPSCKSWFDNSLSNCPYCNFSKDQFSEPEVQEKKKPSIIDVISGSLRQKSKQDESHSSAASDDPVEIDTVPPTYNEDVYPELLPSDFFAQEQEPASTAVAQVDEPTSQPKEKPDEQKTTLGQQIGRVKKTVGRYIDDSGESISPVVGWLVGVKGKCFGQSFPIRDGKNKIGRSTEMEISLLNDDSVSRSCEATIIYDSRANIFHIIPGDSGSLCYLNNEGLYERALLKGMEEIEFGNSGLNKYIFVPLCGENFQWSNYSTK